MWRVLFLPLLFIRAREQTGRRIVRPRGGKKVRSWRDYSISRYSRSTAIVRCNEFVPLRFAASCRTRSVDPRLFRRGFLLCPELTLVPPTRELRVRQCGHSVVKIDFPSGSSIAGMCIDGASNILVNVVDVARHCFASCSMGRFS